MHEYILHSQVPLVREQQVLNILAGVTASQPVPICEQHLVFAQLKVQEAAVSRKAQREKLPQQQQQRGQGPSYHQLIRNVTTTADGKVEGGAWQFRAEQTPEPGVQQFISRTVTEHPADEMDLARLKQKDLYKFKRQYTLTGHRFVYGNVIVRIMRFHIPGDDTTADSPIDAPPIPTSDMKLLDPSGNWIVEATTRVEDTSNGELTEKAKRDLLGFQQFVEGAIDLHVPDRLALDTRVRNV